MSIKTKILIPMIVVTVIATSTILLSAILLFSRHVDQNIENDLNRAMLLIANEIDRLKTKSSFAALYAVNDSGLIYALKNRMQEELINRVVEIYSESEMTIIVVTDERGIVQARGQFPDSHGDDFNWSIVVQSAIEGRHETFVETEPYIYIGVVSGIPAYDAYGALIGTIITGFRMDTDDFVDNLQKLLDCEITVFAGNRRIATTLLDENGNRAVGTEAPENMSKTMLAGEIATGQFNLFGREVLAKYMPIDVRDEEIIGKVFAGRFLAERTDMIWTFVLLGLLILSAVFAISIPTILFITGQIATPITKSLNQLHYDALTAINNRRYLDEQLEQTVKMLSHSGGILSVMMIDIDLFKKYNDTYGHTEGDNCLKIIAEILTKSVRATDFVARYGGEEFTVVLPNTDENGACVAANKILENIRKRSIPHETSDVADYVTVSIGIVSSKVLHGQKGSDFIKRADEMLYKSKQNGRNRYSV